MTPSSILDDCAAGTISPAIALSRLLLVGELPDPETLRRTAEDRDDDALRAMAALAARHQMRLPALRRLAQDGFLPEADDVVAATRRLFDRLALEAPEAGVAFYSFGDAEALAAATAELVEVVRIWSDPAGRRVLDVGCGIGRLAIALAHDADDVLALDLSPGMLAQARRRGGPCCRLRFAESDGRSLAPASDGSIDLLIAADSLPFIVRAGEIERFMAEAARVLRVGGDMLVFNWSYRGDLDADRSEAAALATRFGFTLLRSGDRPFRIWDAAGFHLRRT